MISKENNFEYIDGANLYKGVEGLGSILEVQKEKAPGEDRTLQGSFS